MLLKQRKTTFCFGLKCRSHAYSEDFDNCVVTMRSAVACDIATYGCCSGGFKIYNTWFLAFYTCVCNIMFATSGKLLLC